MVKGDAVERNWYWPLHGGRRAESGTERVDAAQANGAFAGVQWRQNGNAKRNDDAQGQGQNGNRLTQGTGQETTPDGEAAERNQAQPA